MQTLFYFLCKVVNQTYLNSENGIQKKDHSYLVFLKVSRDRYHDCSCFVFSCSPEDTIIIAAFRSIIPYVLYSMHAVYTYVNKYNCKYVQSLKAKFLINCWASSITHWRWIICLNMVDESIVKRDKSGGTQLSACIVQQQKTGELLTQVERDRHVHLVWTNSFRAVRIKQLIGIIKPFHRSRKPVVNWENELMCFRKSRGATCIERNES